MVSHAEVVFFEGVEELEACVEEEAASRDAGSVEDSVFTSGSGISPLGDSWQAADSSEARVGSPGSSFVRACARE